MCISKWSMCSQESGTFQIISSGIKLKSFKGNFKCKICFAMELPWWCRRENHSMQYQHSMWFPILISFALLPINSMIVAWQSKAGGDKLLGPAPCWWPRGALSFCLWTSKNFTYLRIKPVDGKSYSLSLYFSVSS